MGRNRYQVPVKKNQSFTLNITSMTDMFTILLVFLLQSFAAGEVQIDAAEGVRLPSSTTEKIQLMELSFLFLQLN
jgi:Biopolymer transport protein ExbD/TolR